jgi:hypothetical protein
MSIDETEATFRPPGEENAELLDGLGVDQTKSRSMAEVEAEQSEWAEAAARKVGEIVSRTYGWEPGTELPDEARTDTRRVLMSLGLIEDPMALGVTGGQNFHVGSRRLKSTRTANTRKGKAQ